jgi:hypothetical protein
MVAITLLLGGNLWTYSRLTHEVQVGEIRFEKQDGGYLATFAMPDGPKKQFVLKGDEWQLDTRIVKWRSWATLLGKDTLFRLDRISGRYRDPGRAARELPSLVDLRESPWPDIWSMARDYPKLMFMVDAEYGSSVFLPMRDGESYRITMSDTGVLARRVEQ